MDKKIILKRMRHSPFFVIGSITLVCVLLVVFLLPLLLEWNPTKQSLAEKFIAPQGFSLGLKGHILGMTSLADLLTRLYWAGAFPCLSLESSLFFKTESESSLDCWQVTLRKNRRDYYGTCDVLWQPLLVLAIAVIAVVGPSIPNLIIVMPFKLDLCMQVDSQ